MKYASKIIILTMMLIIIIGANLLAYAGGTHRLPVLLYHHLMPGDLYDGDNAFIMRTEDFENHMAWLYDNGYQTATLEEVRLLLYDKVPLPAQTVLITFDDGYYSNIAYAYPILKKYGFHAVIFLITANAGDEPSETNDMSALITAADMAGTEDVFDYASHTHELHKNIDGKTKLNMATQDEIIADLRQSLTFVNYKKALAYPHGQYNRDVINAVQETGIEMAFTIANGYVNKNSDPFRLSRFTVYRDTTFKAFIKYIRNA